MHISPSTLRWWLLITLSCLHSLVHAEPILNVSQNPAVTAGEYTRYFQESGRRLEVSEAIEQFAAKSHPTGISESISIGISVAPVWLKTELQNDATEATVFRFSTETPWLDVIDAWLIHNGKVIHVESGGDATPYEQRPMQYRYFAFETELPPGATQLYMRVETVGPMAIPLRIAESGLAVQRDISSGYQYGLLYGIMLALAMYNLIIYISIRKREYALYAVYLVGFVINSLSYTGQLHTWFTPDWGPYFQDWLNIFLMITYSIAGLHFARVLLNTKSHAPWLDKVTVGVTVFIPAGMVIGALLNNLTLSLVLAFLLNTSFAVLFIALGHTALRNGVAAAKLFLVCSLTAAVCICISTAAVAGLLPYNDMTFKLIEVGMSFEAICLAFLLAQRFRTAEVEKQLALRSARIDSLTGLNNRRGFEHAATPVWYQQLRSGRDISVVILDIDLFKQINDQYGHVQGDEVLKSIAALLQHGARRSDVMARWGGEEFLLLLPDTNEQQAIKHAENLRALVAQARIDIDEDKIEFTASFGVCGTIDGQFFGHPLDADDLDRMIDAADKALYTVKNSGRNKVMPATQVLASA
ncbi:diguanylate cyclase [Alteromonas sp. ASW11-36]|uniref:diguanylate cyclase n=1 Tax=Alteromonas arenosi TaxID=3055817 RepID=A0ABT7STA6_9ALTE|nr:diguanylate cyclase [Alteromonas sp. ASW11-36]MDM7859385.1 diguanylate cyclase [Alteromonas sp. ASW11-36]